ncbi:MAG: hypothetical protein ACXABD_16070, partial [Candidatus Thorarchaeota archaeon]
SYGDNNQTATIIGEFLAEFKCTKTEEADAIGYIDEWIRTETPLRKMPCDLDFPKIGRIPGKLDLGSSQNQYGSRPKEYGVKWISSIDNFVELAEKTKLEAFGNLSDTRITRVLVEKEDPVEIALAYIGAYLTLKEAYTALYNLADSIKEFISTGFDSLSAVLKGAAKIAMNAAYAAAILFALNELLKNISDLLFDIPRAYRGIKIFDTLKRGVESLGYRLDSSLSIGAYKDLCLLLSTNYEGRQAGNPNYDYYQETTLLNLFDICAELFNARIRVGLDKVVRFENVATYETTPANVQLKELFQEGTYSFKTDELPVEIALNYLPSLADEKYPRRTYKELFKYKGSDGEGANRKQLVINFAVQIADRKTKQTQLEKIFSSIFDLFAGLNKAYKPKAGERLGYLRVTNRGIPQNLVYFPDPKVLFDSFYTSERPQNNQFQWFTGRAEENICDQADITALTVNNIVKDYNGDTVILRESVRDASNGLWSFTWKKRLGSGDFGYISEDNFTVKVVEYDG